MHKYDIDQNELAKTMGRLGLAWDGQWFLKTFEKYGLETAFELNTKVRESFARIEMREMLRTLNKDRADNIEDALDIIIQYVFYAFGKNFQVEREQEKGTQVVYVNRCSIHENCQRAGLERADQCCESCAKMWPAWVERLLPGDGVKVDVHQQIGKGAEKCVFSFTPST